MLAFDPDGKNASACSPPASAIASGSRSIPTTGDLWCSTNERDGLGDNLVPDYVTRVREGAFYGWPWYYLGDNEDPRHAGERADLKDKITVPDVLMQAHSASLGLTFYNGSHVSRRILAATALPPSTARGTGRSAPATRSSAFALKDGVPTGEYEDFVTGFVDRRQQRLGTAGRRRGRA